MSYTSQQTQNQTLSGIISITDGTLTIENGIISNIQGIDVQGDAAFNADVHIVGDANIDGLLTVGQAQSSYTPVFNNDIPNKLYTDSQDNLRVLKSGDTMTGSLSMNTTNKITNLATGTNPADAVNRSQLDNYVDLTTVQTIGGSKTFSNQVIFNGTTKTNLVATDIPNAGTRTWLDSTGIQTISGTKNFGNSVAFNGPSVTLTNGATCNNKNITNVLNPVNAQDVATKNYVDTHSNNSNYLLRDGTLPMSGVLNMNTTNKIINLANGTNPADAVNKTQLDLKADKTYVDSQDATKADTSYVNTQLALKADITYVDSQDNLKVNRAGDTMTNVLTINKNATIQQNETTVITSFNISSSNTFYDYINFSGTSATVVLPKTNGGDSTMVNKAVYIYFPNTSTLTLSAAAAGSCLINGGNWVNYVINIGTGGVRKVRIVGLSTIGSYTVENISGIDSIDQLTLKSNYGLNANSEFSGINFNNNNTDVGYIRVETNRLNNNNSTMSFQVRQTGGIIKPLEINNNIIAYVPIIASSTITANGIITRNAWSSGELIKTTIFSRATTGVSKIANANPGTALDWLFPTLTLRNTPTNSIVVMDFDAPYHFTGAAQDTLELYVYDTTGGIANLVFAKSQYYDGAGGGGTRSGPIFPFSFSHTPSQATTTATRTYQITLLARSATDTLKLCQGVFNGAVINLDYYTCEMKEIKI